MRQIKPKFIFKTKRTLKKYLWMNDEICIVLARKNLIQFMKEVGFSNIEINHKYFLTQTRFDKLTQLIRKYNFNNKFNELIK